MKNIFVVVLLSLIFIQSTFASGKISINKLKVEKPTYNEKKSDTDLGKSLSLSKAKWNNKVLDKDLANPLENHIDPYQKNNYKPTVQGRELYNRYKGAGFEYFN